MSAAYAQGLKLSSQGRHAEAIAQFEAALAQEPNDTKVLFALGNTASQLGLGGPAEQFFRRVLALELVQIWLLTGTVQIWFNQCGQKDWRRTRHGDIPSGEGGP